MSETCRCIRCEKPMNNILDGFDARAGLKKGYQPTNGLAFYTQGHYGSTYFDPMNDSYLEVCVCDECVEAAEKAGRVHRYDAETREVLV